MFGVTAGLFGTFSSTAFLNEDLKIIEQSYNHYQNMIKYAEQNPELIVEGVVERTGYASEFDLFYVVYSVENDKGWPVISHAESFAMYSATEISKYKKDSPIYIVVESLPIEYTTDNINLDYKNVSLEEDAEYAYVVNQIKNTNITKVVLILIDATCLAVIVLLIVKNVKKKKQEELESSTNNTSTTSSTTTATPVSKYCEYCGSKLPDNASKCPLCGAHIKK
jgi:rubrerythrin